MGRERGQVIGIGESFWIILVIVPIIGLWAAMIYHYYLFGIALLTEIVCVLLIRNFYKEKTRTLLEIARTNEN